MSITPIFIWVIIASLIVFDAIIIWRKGKYESISAHVIRASYKYPLIVLLFGIVLGHLFWSMKTEDWSGKTPCEQTKGP